MVQFYPLKYVLHNIQIPLVYCACMFGASNYKIVLQLAVLPFARFAEELSYVSFYHYKRTIIFFITIKSTKSMCHTGLFQCKSYVYIDYA
jgi:hypothetical protein